MIGVERIGFFTTNAVFSHSVLAQKTKQDVKKFTDGLGQTKMSIITPDQDVLSMAYNAVQNALIGDKINITNKQILKDIDMVLFASESQIDSSKASAIELHSLLKLQEQCKCLDIKQACYGGTGAVMLAKDYIQNHPKSKVLVVMSDVAFYGIKSQGEATQGCGAVAMIISSSAKICSFNDDSVVLTSNCYDFYRPVFKTTPICDGHFSIKNYLKIFQTTINIYKNNIKNNNRKNMKDGCFDILCVHSPFAKMLDKCNPKQKENKIIKQYSSVVGNVYTASLYLSFLSLLDNSKQDLSNKKIGLFSYGSGSECELFSVKILKNYRKYLNTKDRNKMLLNRQVVDYNIYKKLWKIFEQRESNLNFDSNKFKKYLSSYCQYYKTSKILKLSKIVNGIRYYNFD